MDVKTGFRKRAFAIEGEISGSHKNTILPSVRIGSTILVLLIAIVIAILLYSLYVSGIFKSGSRSSKRGTIKEQELISKVERVIDSGGDINAKQNKAGQTLLHLAVELDSVEATELLLTNGADVSARNMLDATPLLMATRGDSVEIVRLLIIHGADANTKSAYIGTALWNAALWGKAEMAELLLKNGADVDAHINGHFTPLQATLNSLQSDDLMREIESTPERQRKVIEVLRRYGAK